MDIIETELTSGFLKDYCNKVKDALLYNVNPNLHAKTYERPTNNLWFAEPEFSGKYIDICVQNYIRYQDKKFLNYAKTVVDSILSHQREDGFLGGLTKGKEFLSFGVWNQTFTIFGLLSYYEVTNETAVLEAAKKSASYVMEYFISGKGDILDAPNGGTQHISILLPLCRIYELTFDDKIRLYIEHIVDRIKKSSLNYFDFDNILNLRSRKGIESIVILLGILKYASLFDDISAIESVKKYWQQVNDTQIRNTGNGTIKEFWTENGNGCMFLSADTKPNETCVAVGWCELSLALFYLDGDSKYLDAFDKTLYNHILASISDDGTDFAYYQPNFGKRVRMTEKSLYKCCRYRGFTLFSYMNNMLYYEDDKSIVPMIYTSNTYKSSDTVATMQTNYPYGNSIKISVTCNKSKIIKLRVPSKCSFESICVNGIKENFNTVNNFIEIIANPETATNIHIVFNNNLVAEYGCIDDKKYVSFSYGCLLLAAHNIKSEIKLKNDVKLHKTDNSNGNHVFFEAMDSNNEKVEFTEYASADDYYVWIPIE